MLGSVNNGSARLAGDATSGSVKQLQAERWCSAVRPLRHRAYENDFTSANEDEEWVIRSMARRDFENVSPAIRTMTSGTSLTDSLALVNEWSGRCEGRELLVASPATVKFLVTPIKEIWIKCGVRGCGAAGLAISQMQGCDLRGLHLRVMGKMQGR